MAKLAIAIFLAISLVLFSRLSFSRESLTGRRILVLLDDLSIKSSHSIFFNSLRSRGFDLDFKLAEDKSLSLQRYSQYLYDGLVLFSPSVERFGGALDLGAVLDFVDSGHNLIIAADSSASDLIKSVATECGVDFDEDPSAMVIDHNSYAVSETEGDHTLIAADDFIESDAILGKNKIEVSFEFCLHFRLL
uniref:Dolichyl-diphosphooligosaccharide--protein glycosyltransferase 48 kDa subunit n=1 Tax=Rhizophora mucronata TaxID=61149 RepID=A0A2P2M4U8_RHIMU